MDSSNLKHQLAEIVKTKQEAEYLKNDIQKLASALFNTKANITHEIDTYIPFDKKEQFLSLFGQNQITFQDLENTQKFLALITETLNDIPVISLQIAIEPKQETIDTISDWFSQRLNKEVLLDIVVKKELLAGCVIINNGIFRDYSIKKKIEDRFNNVDSVPLDANQNIRHDTNIS